MPVRLGAAGSVRASSRHQSACSAPLAHTFWPLTTIARRRSRRALVLQGWRGRSRRRARRSPGTRSRRRGSRQVPPPLLVGAGGEQRRRGVVDRHERQHQPGRVVGGQLLVQHDLLGGRHAAAPLGRPVGHGVAGARAAPGTTPSGRRRTRRRRTPVCAGAPVGGHVLAAPVAHLGPELVELARSTSLTAFAASGQRAAGGAPRSPWWRPRRRSRPARRPRQGLGEVHVDDPLGALQRLGGLGGQARRPAAAPRAAARRAAAVRVASPSSTAVAAGMRSPV